MKKQQWLNVADVVFHPFWFKLIMIVATLLTAVPAIHLYIGSYVKLLLGYGIVTVVYQVVRGRLMRFLRDKAGWLLVAFAVSYGITCLVARGNLGANISALAYMAVFFALFVMWTAENSREETVRELRVLAWAVTVVTLVFALANFAMFAGGIGGEAVIRGETVKYGMVDNRLFGLYNANTGSTLCVISFILSGGLLLDERRSKGAAVFHAFNMLFQFICLLLTGSRAALYVLYVLIAAVAFIVVLRRPNARGKLLRLGKSAGVAVTAVLVLFGSMHGLRTVLSYVPVWTAQLRVAVTAPEGEDVPITVPPYDFTRLEESENRDGGFFNGRVDLWEAGLGAFKESPVFGVGRENLYDRAEQYLVDKQWDKNLAVGGLHNIYLTILTCSGAVGLLLMGAYAVWVLCRAGSGLVRDTARDAWFVVLLALAVMFFITEFVEARILYQVNIFNVLFWVLFGYLNAMARDRRQAPAEETV